MLIADLLLDWIESDRFKGLSVKSRATYASGMRAFSAAHVGLTLGGLTFAKVRNYLVKMHAHKPSCVGGARAAIRHFCLYVAETYGTFTAPSFDFDLPRVPRRQRDPVPSEHVARIVEAASRLPCPPYRAALYRASVAILVYSGMRRSEVVTLSEDDFDAELGIIYIRHGKGDKARKVRMPLEAITIINAYRGLRGKVEGNARLLQWRHGRQFGESGLITAVAMSCKVAGVPKYCCHRFRHSYGTRLVEQDVPLSTIQKLMGHADLSTTGMYLHAGEGSMKDAAEKSANLSPKRELPQKHRIRKNMRLR